MYMSKARLNSEGYKIVELKKLLGKDFAWYEKGCPVPAGSLGNGCPVLWKKSTEVRGKINEAVKSGKLVKVEPESTYIAPTCSYISDEMIGGVFCPADGKTYESKSSYYKAVKSKGLEIVGDDPIKPSAPKTEKIDWGQAVHESLQQLKGE